MKHFLPKCLLILAIITCVLAGNTRPIIGIVAWPEPSWPKASYSLPASYVKWIEGAGARVAPLLMSFSNDHLVKLLHQVNGVLLIGGGGDITEGSPIRTFVELIYKEVIAMNDAGQHVPLWGTCLGFEVLASIMSEGDTILSAADATDVCLPIVLSKECNKYRTDCTLFGRKFPSSITQLATSPKEPVLYNWHSYCVTPESFNNHTAFSSKARIVATSVDLKGTTFVAAYEALKYPIYAVQWHSEKAQYEWQPSNIDHSWSAITVSAYLAHFLVQEAMLNDNKFSSSDDETNALIYNYSPTFTAKVVPDYHFTEVYFF